MSAIVKQQLPDHDVSKFLFRHHDKHFFDLANFGIVAAITFTNDAWGSFGRWGTDWVE